MPLDTFVRFDAKPAEIENLRHELLAVVTATRTEPGCLGMSLFESTNLAGVFYIHSLWQDDAAIEAHFRFPHMTHFLAILNSLASIEVKAVRTRRIF